MLAYREWGLVAFTWEQLRWRMLVKMLRHQMETLPPYWPFVRGIHRSPVNSPHKGQWRGAVMFSLICTWINGWVNKREASDLRRHCAHYDVIVMSRDLVSHHGVSSLRPIQDGLHFADDAFSNVFSWKKRSAFSFNFRSKGSINNKRTSIAIRLQATIWTDGGHLNRWWFNLPTSICATLPRRVSFQWDESEV